MAKGSKQYWSHKVTKTAGNTTQVVDYCSEVFKVLGSRTATKKAIAAGRLKVNGKVPAPGAKVRSGDFIELKGSGVRAVRKMDIDVEVLFEDDHLLVANKPGGIAVNGNRHKTLENALATKNRGNRQPDALPRPIAVHRIDVPTCGLVLLAKTKTAQIELSKAFQENRVQKAYLAVVHGQPAAEGVIESPVQGKKAKTNYETLRTVPSRIFGNLSLLKLRPITGRTHQLRIHLAGGGYLIVGDKQYAGEQRTILGKGMLLCACGLSFTHPANHSEVKLKIDAPPKFYKLLDREMERFAKGVD